MGIVTPTDTIVYNPDAEAVIFSGYGKGTVSDNAAPPAKGESGMILAAKAFLRDLYATLGKL